MISKVRRLICLDIILEVLIFVTGVFIITNGYFGHFQIQMGVSALDFGYFKVSQNLGLSWKCIILRPPK